MLSRGLMFEILHHLRRIKLLNVDLKWWPNKKEQFRVDHAGWEHNQQKCWIVCRLSSAIPWGSSEAWIFARSRGTNERSEDSSVAWILKVHYVSKNTVTFIDIPIYLLVIEYWFVYCRSIIVILKKVACFWFASLCLDWQLLSWKSSWPPPKRWAIQWNHEPHWTTSIPPISQCLQKFIPKIVGFSILNHHFHLNTVNGRNPSPVGW